MKNISKKEFILSITAISGVLILYFLALVNNVNLEEYVINIAMFNVTFSVGLAAIIIASITLIHKSQTKELKPQIIKFVNEFVVFVLLNFLLMMSSYTNVDLIIHLLMVAAFSTTLVIIFGTRSFLRIYLEKLKP